MDKKQFLQLLEQEKFMEDYVAKLKVRYLIFSALFAFGAIIINKNFYVQIILFLLMIVALIFALHYDRIMHTYEKKPISMAYYSLCAGFEPETLFWLYFLLYNKTHKDATYLWYKYPDKKDFDKQTFNKALKVYKKDDYKLQSMDNKILNSLEQYCQNKSKDPKAIEKIKRLIENKWEYIKKTARSNQK